MTDRVVLLKSRGSFRKNQGRREASVTILLIPSNAVIELSACSPKNVKSASDCQVHLPFTAFFDEVEITDSSATTSVCYR